MTLDDVIATLTLLREYREAEALTVAAKRITIQAYAAQAREQGISGRRLAEHLQGELRLRGWTDQQIRSVGISPASIDLILYG